MFGTSRFFFFFLGGGGGVVIGVIGFVLCFLWVGLINKTCTTILASSWLGWACTFVMAVLNFISLILILCLYIYIYILVIGNIINKSLFMQVEIAKNLLLFNEITTIFFI